VFPINGLFKNVDTERSPCQGKVINQRLVLPWLNTWQLSELEKMRACVGGYRVTSRYPTRRNLFKLNNRASRRYWKQ